ncbi:tetratricopeptide repeat-containing sulfotransferase family protein [Niveispirillum sp.]|uniref:tetratricopeptide repeat-containing sulfotransferase family protein n=1 Tax=Niveispirillum sp. TaxID=1917217 RepID=UPI001B40128E|nr:tetratricopeptide repeat-containing sulfotransferase family protein [Niveispirillum sp.]MBP7336015.1 sulfotransferase [Niveispirillum sp.]
MTVMIRQNDLHAAALAALIAGRPDKAEALLRPALACDPADAAGWSLLARAMGDRGRFVEELEMCGRAVALAPATGEYQAQLGKCHARRMDIAAAEQCARAALACSPLSDLVLDAIAAIHTRLGQHEQAAKVLRRAADEGSRNPAVHFNLGSSLKFTGDFDGARAALETAIGLAPRYIKAHAALTSLGGISVEHNHLDRLTGLITAVPDARDRIHLAHAAARECEALGRYDEAFAHLRDGKVALLKTLGADPRESAGALTAVLVAPTPAIVGTSPARPVFVVGMPRSGTTLVDRILSGHPDLTSIGEFQHFAQLLRQATGVATRHLVDGAVLEKVAAGRVDLDGIGHAYVEKGRQLAGGVERFLDKFHLNIQLVGLIAAALPQARFVCLIRNPLDSVVSNYRQLFEFATPLYRYSLDLAAAAEFYTGFRQLAARWAALLPDRFEMVEYEALVADPEPGVRRLLDFCGLSWHPACVRIEENRAAVATASAVQVRQPINTSSVGGWRRYAAHLGPAQAVLGSAAA